MLIRFLGASAAALALTALTACGGTDGGKAEGPEPLATSETRGAGGTCSYPAGGEAARDVKPPSSTPTRTGTVKATLDTSVGKLVLTLDADKAPCTVNSFDSLASQKYYDDTTCHRLTTPASGISVLQCGDPLGKGYGGPGYTIPDEVDGSETYPAGTVAMANTSMPDSGGSQFFLVYGETPLPPSYTVFGTIDDSSLKTLQTVAEKGTEDGGPDGAPAENVTISHVSLK